MNRTFLMCLAAVAAVALAGVLAFSLFPRASTQKVVAAGDLRYLLPEEPTGSEEVLSVRSSAKDQQDVVVVGRIGGRVNPWIADSAAFSIVDRSLTPCSEMAGDTCQTPWDYCCEADLPSATLLVTVHDVDGKLVKTDARKLLGVKELDTVVVQGQARRDKDGNVSVVASKVYVKRGPAGIVP